jgi:hypothetical protein
MRIISRDGYQPIGCAAAICRMPTCKDFVDLISQHPSDEVGVAWVNGERNATCGSKQSEAEVTRECRLQDILVRYTTVVDSFMCGGCQSAKIIFDIC